MEIVKETDAATTGIDIFTIYQAHQCPAEISVPFRLKRIGFLGTIVSLNRFLPHMMNLDSPWMIAALGALALNIACAIVLGLVQAIIGGNHPEFLFIQSLLAMLFACCPLVYACLVLTNLTDGYGTDVWWTLVAPTHLGLTDSGFKIYYRGGWFYNYPALATWDDMTSLDIIEDRLLGGYSLRLHYQSSAYCPKDITLPLQGFQSEQQMQRALQHFDKNLPAAKKGQRWLEWSNGEFKLARQQYRKETTPADVPDPLEIAITGDDKQPDQKN